MSGVAVDEPEELRVLAALRREADTLAYRLELAMDAVSHIEDRDDSGRVAVLLDADSRVRRIRLERDWRRVLRPADLAGAVLAAYTRATERQLEAWAVALARPVDPDVPLRPVRTPEPHQPDQTWESPDRAWETLCRQLPRLAGIGAELARNAAAEVSGRDGDSRVTTRVAGGRLVGIEFDNRWLSRAGAADIGESTTHAVLNAYAVIDRGATDIVAPAAPLADPLGMLAALGFPVPTGPRPGR